MRLCSCGAQCGDDAEACATCGAALGTDSDGGGIYAAGELFGPYRLLEQIGQGGMGRVFLAEHTRLGRRVALKMLRPEFSNNIEAVKRFFAEARAVNRIKHENIIEVTDFIESTRGRSVYIMELLNGVDLRSLEERDGALPIGRALGIAIQVCRGLGAAHDAGIVHRDLKPDNVFLADRGDGRDFVKLVDFGVAKLMDEAADDVSRFRTSAGVVIGTPEYMSPEQAAGDPADHRSDVYALGVILFEMITGRRPFEASTAREVMAQHVTVPAPRPSKMLRFAGAMPAALEELILDCLHKRPDDRPQSMTQVERRLEDIARRLSVPVMTPPSTSGASDAARVGRRWLWLAGATAAALGVLVAWAVMRPRPVAMKDVAERPAHRPAPAAARANDAQTPVAAARAETRLAIEPMPAPLPASSVGAVAARGDGTASPSEARPISGPPAVARAKPHSRSSGAGTAAGAHKLELGKLDHSTVLNPFE